MKLLSANRTKKTIWFATPVLLIILLLAYQGFANRAASQLATEFCSKAHPGEPILPLLAPGAGWKLRPIYDQEDSQYVFVFPGFGMDKAICSVTVMEGKVRATEASMFYD